MGHVRSNVSCLNLSRLPKFSLVILENSCPFLKLFPVSKTSLLVSTISILKLRSTWLEQLETSSLRLKCLLPKLANLLTFGINLFSRSEAECQNARRSHVQIAVKSGMGILIP